VCFKKCYNLEKIAVNRNCFETCYNKYIMTLSTVHKSLKEYGYKYQSIYAYKAFPEEDEWFDFVYSGAMTRGGPPNGVYLESDGKKSR
jgi:hypothetical protein